MESRSREQRNVKIDDFEEGGLTSCTCLKIERPVMGFSEGGNKNSGSMKGKVSGQLSDKHILEDYGSQRYLEYRCVVGGLEALVSSSISQSVSSITVQIN
jgi:hypothetical protein